MYGELIKDLRENHDKYFARDMEAADAIEELQKAVYFHKYNSEFLEDKYNSLADEKWIPVTERLPEEEEVVLVWGGVSVYTAKRHNKYGGLMWWKLNSKQHYCNPTHWMPLPKAPESEDE